MTVEQKQCLLKYLGYYDGKVDDIWGPGSEQGTKDLQKASGIKEDGIFGDGTLAAAKDAVANDRFKTPKRPVQPQPTDLEGLFHGIRYWSPAEFRCQCGGRYCTGFPAMPSRKLLELLDDIRERAGGPAFRSSGLRCPPWNKIQKGVANSRHQYGKAMDFRVEGKTGGQLLAIAKADPRTRYAYQIKDKDGNLTQYIHVDVE